MEAFSIEQESEGSLGMGTPQNDPGTAPARGSKDQAQLLATGCILKAVIRLVPKSRMREIRTYGSVVGPAQKWAGLPDSIGRTNAPIQGWHLHCPVSNRLLKLNIYLIWRGKAYGKGTNP